MKQIIILCIALFATNAIAGTTNWYVDGLVYQTTTCESGTSVTPPTPPAKHGYTFVGWYDADVTVGTWHRTGTPTPDNPTYPTFYQDGNLILRALGSGVDTVADTYNQTTGKITRRVGVKVLDGTEAASWMSVIGYPGYYYVKNASMDDIDVTADNGFCSHFVFSTVHSVRMHSGEYTTGTETGLKRIMFQANSTLYPTLASFQQWLADQYANGTPVTVYYPLDTPVEETYVP